MRTVLLGAALGTLPITFLALFMFMGRASVSPRSQPEDPGSSSKLLPSERSNEISALQDLRVSSGYCPPRTFPAVRYELYMGESIKSDQAGRSTLSDREWRDFESQVITPRLPKGYSILSIHGGGLDEKGLAYTEPAKRLVVLAPSRQANQLRRRIMEIESRYIKLFSQDSVLRTFSQACSSLR